MSASLPAWAELQEWLMMNVGSKEADEASVIASRMIAQEREACAKIAAQWLSTDDDVEAATAKDIAAAIRSRKDKP